MNRQHLIETFNTHRMSAAVIQAVKTARDSELAEVMRAVRRAADQPQQTAQHLIVYGERGSGKSFLMRLVEIEIERLAREEGLPIAPALLPEEQYNIRAAPQLIQAIAAKVRGENWTFAMDFRPLAEAWEAAVAELDAALDRRFGPGLGLVVAMVENFDTLTRNLFGGSAVTQKKTASARAIEQSAAEQLLRKLMNRKGSRLMLIVTATGTVDLDYERPLFQAFKTLDLRIWTPDDCIAYFNRRRALEQQAELSPQEEARARAIAEFIGGNPRLAQLLGEVLSSPDARSIAATLDALSDHLADYYRRRLNDLPPQSAALLDALIRKGEPCTQTELAARVGASSQAQIADAFSYLLSSRLLAAGSDKLGAGKLYRLRDRLFVHFYRRRYGEPEQALGLAPIAELLESFFTQREREQQARRHLEAGEWADARLYALNSRFLSEPSDGFCWYRDEAVIGTPSELFRLAGLSSDEAIAAQTELKLNPDRAVNRWKDTANRASSGLNRTVASLLEARALSRCQMDNEAEAVLAETLRIAEVDGDKDSQILALDEMVSFTFSRRKDRARALDLSARAGELAEQAYNDYIRAIALFLRAWNYSKEVGRYREAITVFDQAGALASNIGSQRLLEHALRHKAYSLNLLKHYDEAASVVDQAAELAAVIGTVHYQIEALCLKGRSLAKLDHTDEASSAFDTAFRIAKSAGQKQQLIDILEDQSNSLGRQKPEQTLTLAREAIAETGNTVSAEALWTARRIFFTAAARTQAVDVVEVFETCLAEATTDESAKPLANMFDEVLTAVAYNSLWDELTACLLRHPQSLPFLKSWRPFGEVGRVWSEQVKADGRAQTYALVARQLPAIVRLTKILPYAGEEAGTSGYLRGLIDGLVSYCDDAGFLQDMAELLKESFGEQAETEVQRLRAFAEVHAAPDKETVLQRLDPDWAHAIRRILGLPAPDDLLARKGRRKGR